MTIDTHIYRTRFSEEDIGTKKELWAVLCRDWFPAIELPLTRTYVLFMLVRLCRGGQH